VKLGVRFATSLFVTALAAMPEAGQGVGRADKLVHVDAIAADGSGRRIQDLKASDFEVVERGETRPIDSVRFVKATGDGSASETPPVASVEQEQAEAERDGTRLFAIFLDEYHVSPGAPTERVRAAMLRFIDQFIGPRDLVLVAKPLDSLTNLRLTRDREVIREAIARFAGRKGDLTPKTAFERNYIPPDPARVEAIRSQIVLSALSAISGHLGSLNVGRKTVLLVSEGFAPPARRRGDLPLPAVDGVAHAANRANVSIYPIDPRAFGELGRDAASDAGTDLDLLRKLATDTDAFPIFSQADASSGFQRIVSDASGYYVISFSPNSKEETGRFHAADIRVTRAGVTLRTRNGYWEPTPDADAVLRRAIEATPAVAVVRHSSPIFKPWFGMSPAEGGKTRVQFTWEPAAAVPGAGVRSKVAAPVRASVSVLDKDGEILFQQEVRPVGFEGDGETRASFDLPPGRVTLNTQIEDANNQLIDTDIRDLTIPAFSGGAVIGTAEVFRARNARELRTIQADPNRVPVVSRQFSRADSLYIRIPVHADQNADLAVTLVSAMGAVMRDIPVQVESPEWRSVEVPLAALAAGEYRLDFAIATGTSNTRGVARDSIAFRVTP
jgi:VWFA-related protein